MGMYTELDIAVTFPKDVPEDVITVLREMVNPDFDSDGFDIPDSIKSHPLFRTKCWSFMLRGDNPIFDGFSNSKIYWDFIIKVWQMGVRCSFTNNDNEIEQFLDFIAPYISTCGFMGYIKYDADEMPTLIFRNHRTGKITLRKPKACAEESLDYVIK